MSTGRKHWFKVADSILRDGWTHDELAMMVKLLAWLNQRWARDGLSAEEACHARLSRAALHEISGRSQRASGVSALRVLGERLSISVQVEGDFTLIHWPKCAEFQEWGARQSGKQSADVRPEVALSETQDADADLNPPKSPPKGDVLTDLWQRIQAAFSAHGKRGERMKLTEARRKRLRARLREHGETELIEAVHGYIATHGKSADDRFDPMRNFTPETIFGTKCAKYIEAAEAKTTEKPRWQTELDHRKAVEEERRAIALATSPSSRRPSNVPGVTRMSDIPRRRH